MGNPVARELDRACNEQIRLEEHIWPGLSAMTLYGMSLYKPGQVCSRSGVSRAPS